MEQLARVLVVDDERLFAELLSHTLSGQQAVEIIGVATDGESAIHMADTHRPDAVIMDIELGSGMDGIEAAMEIKNRRPETGVVILSSHKDRRYVTSLPINDSSGWSYLLKQSVPDVSAVVRAVQGSINGMVVLDPSVVTALVPRSGTGVSRLTPRQRQVLELIAQGYNNASVAEKLTLTEKSVETYINAIYQELGVSGEEGIHARVRATLMYIEDSQDR